MNGLEWSWELVKVENRKIASLTPIWLPDLVRYRQKMLTKNRDVIDCAAKGALVAANLHVFLLILLH